MIRAVGNGGVIACARTARTALESGASLGGYRNKAKNLERAKGIEPSYAAWEAAVLPLNYARSIFMLNT